MSWTHHIVFYAGFEEHAEVLDRLAGVVTRFGLRFPKPADPVQPQAVPVVGEDFDRPRPDKWYGFDWLAEVHYVGDHGDKLVGPFSLGLNWIEEGKCRCLRVALGVDSYRLPYRDPYDDRWLDSIFSLGCELNSFFGYETTSNDREHTFMHRMVRRQRPFEAIKAHAGLPAQLYCYSFLRRQTFESFNQERWNWWHHAKGGMRIIRERGDVLMLYLNEASDDRFQTELGIDLSWRTPD